MQGPKCEIARHFPNCTYELSHIHFALIKPCPPVCTFYPFPFAIPVSIDGREWKRKIEDKHRELDRCRNLHLIIVSLNMAFADILRESSPL